MLSLTDKRVYVLGIGDDGAAGLPGTAHDVVAAADVLVGGERQLGLSLSSAVRSGWSRTD